MSKTPMEAACDEIPRIYHEYSNHTAGPDRATLDQNVFKKMMEEQLPNWIKVSGQLKMSQTPLEAALEIEINIFHQYSVRHGNFDTISKKEMSQLMKKELPNLVKQAKKNPEAMDALFSDLEDNEDGQLGFGEFMAVVTKVATASHDHL